MRLLVSTIFILAVAVGLALILGSGGSATFFWQNYRIDLSLATFFVSILIILFTVFSLGKLFIVLYGLPGRLYSLRAERRNSKKQELIFEIFTAALLGDTFKLKGALRKFKKDFWDNENGNVEKRIVCLIAISFGQEIFDNVEKRNWVDDLKSVEFGLDVRYRSSELAHAELVLRDGRSERLAKPLLDFLVDNPKSSYGRLLLIKVLLSEGRWEEVIQQARILSKNTKSFSVELRSALYESIKNLLRQEGLNSIKINRTVGLLKKEELSDSKIIGLLAQAYFGVGDREQGANLLEAYLTKKWDAALGRMYWKYPNNTKLQLRVVSKWKKHYDKFDTFHICFGNICMREKLWAKAKEHLFNAVEIRPSVDALSSLARVHDLAGEPEQANKFWKEATELFSAQNN